MKYLLRQMLAFWVVILTVMIVVSLSFNSLTRQSMLNTFYSQMYSYARSVINMNNDNEAELLENIVASEKFLKNQKIEMVYFDSEGNILYPVSENNLFVKDTTLSPQQLKRLYAGEELSLTKQYALPQGNIEYAMIFQPIFTNEVDDELSGVLGVFHPVSLIDSSVAEVKRNLLTAFLISSLVALIFSYVFAQFQVNRINNIKRAIKKIGEGDFDVKVEVKGDDELDELAVSFNKMAKDLKKSDEEISWQEEQRRQFMANAAHEMRTPLTTINGLLEGLAYQAIPEDQVEKSILLMRKETKRLIRLVNENLDYEKIRTNQIEMKRQVFNATEVLKDLVTQLSQKAEESGDTLTLISKENSYVYADYDRFVQILFNIIQNAVQFTQNGSIEVELVKEPSATVIHVRDTGEGMTEEEMRSIWERYYKADPSRKSTKYGESGLGLSIVKQLMILHGGKVEVWSEKGKGTTFSMIFPDKEGE